MGRPGRGGPSAPARGCGPAHRHSSTRIRARPEIYLRGSSVTGDPLTDSDVLVPFVSVRHPLRPVVLRAVVRLWRRGERLVTVAQNCAEFWNVLTRPTTARNGHGLPPAQADVY